MRKIEWAKASKIMIILAILCLIFMLLLTMIDALLVSQETIGEQMAGVILIIGEIITVFIGSLIAAERVGRGKMIISILTGGAVVVTLILINLIFFGTETIGIDFRGVGIMGAACAAGLVSGRKRERR